MKRIVNPGIRNLARQATHQKHQQQNYIVKPAKYWTQQQQQIPSWKIMVPMVVKNQQQMQSSLMTNQNTLNRSYGDNPYSRSSSFSYPEEEDVLTAMTSRAYHATPVTREGEITIQSKNIYMNMIDTTYEVIVDELEKQFERIDSQDEFYFEDDATAIMVHCGQDKLFVLSRQLPARQLWYSSPISGPWHYNLVETEDGHAYYWKCTRGDIDLLDRFQQEINECLAEKGVEIQLPYNVNSQ